MNLEDQLLSELKALRAGSGLTEARLREQPTLNQHIEGDTVSERFNRLVELVNLIRDREQRFAVLYAYGLEGGSTRQAKERRDAAVQLMPMSLRTLDRRENDGCKDLARIIVERSPALTESERQGEIDYTTSMEKRFSDLEFLVLYMARQSVLRDNNPENESGLVKTLWFKSYRSIKRQHAVVQRQHRSQTEEFYARVYGLIERLGDDAAKRAWKERFGDDDDAS
ncbi:hypothetical protein [Streptomyces sp. NPDC056401]|uniref:hypothetical protein n=1 Tax=Streptomyces sp. NPDC056401 TaxID=3345809 RepID=UPI0035DA2D86